MEPSKDQHVYAVHVLDGQPIFVPHLDAGLQIGNESIADKSPYQSSNHLLKKQQGQFAKDILEEVREPLERQTNNASNCGGGNSNISVLIKCPKLCCDIDSTRLESLRMLSLIGSNKISLKQVLENEEGTPLFLATDVFQSYNSSSKNLTRIHQRYAQKGEAIKLKLENARLMEGSNTQNLWFYTIQGLFKASFEYNLEDLQKVCISKLQEAWMKFYSKKVPPELTVTVNNDSCATSRNMNDESEDAKDKKCDTSPLVVEGILEDTHQHLYFSTLAADDFESYLRKLSIALKRMLLNMNSHWDVECCQSITAVIDIIFMTKNSSKKYNHPLYVSNVFPIHLLNNFVLRTTDASSRTDFKNSFGIPYHKNIALCLVSDWLGKELNKLAPSISTKVEQFKTEHINSIDELPAAQDLVESLFPKCMILLLYNWIHQSNCAESGESTGVTECGPLSKRKKTDQNVHFGENSRMTDIGKNHSGYHNQIQNHPYPIIQLILEFANSSLVSGVSHVVYSRLLH